MANSYPTHQSATILLVAVLAAILSPRARGAAAEETIYPVGVAQLDITPSYPIRLSGFGFRRDESEGVTHPIFAKAMVIGSDEERPLVLIAVDSLGLRLSMIDEVAARLQAKAGIERDRVAVTFTHTHTAPKLNGACDTIFSTPIPPEHQAHIDRYTKELTDALERVALAALHDRQPAKLSWAKGTVGFAKNRRTAGGPVDHDLPMLVVKSADDSTIRAIYVSYACHCVTLSNNKISGDWAGFAAAAIEHSHPGAIAFVSIGCGSDSNPDSGVTGDKAAVAAEQGGQIAAEVERLLPGSLTPVTGATSATLARIDLPLNDPPTRAELQNIAARGDAPGYNAKFQLAKLDRGESLLTAIEYPIQTWSFGDSLSMIFLGGEVCVDYSIRLKQELDPSRIWTHGYANDFGCYIPSERLVREGGYGGGAETVYFALPNTLKAGLENKIVAEIHRQVPDAFASKAAAAKDDATHPWSPAKSLAAMQVADDLLVELMAAEPLVVDPVAIDFGPDGRLWVAEMRDYTRGVDEKFDQTGQVSVLIDTNGDGIFDQSSAFVTGLRFPTDVKVWREGVIVCDAPDVIYLEDTDGDGRADVRKMLLTGFATHNAQARVNSLRWGLDGWLYGSCGLFGGDIKSFTNEELTLGARDFRFLPDTGKIEAVTGCTQQGRVRDEWQNWFGCENGALVNHYPLNDKYLARAPHVVPPTDTVFVPAGPDANQLFPLGDLVLFELSGPPGRPTAACGLEVYRDELLGPAFRGNAFTAEPVNQLIHREVLSPRGVTFAGQRAAEESQREFLASTDQWFRPVQVRTGPDGCLWIVDMHRLVIEHPRFIPPEVLRDMEVMEGNTAGRIYRVRPKRQAARPWLRLDNLDIDGLVAALDSPNGPQRDAAQQIIVHRADRAAAPLLEELFATSQRPEVRLQAIYTLAGLEALRAEMLLRALKDPHPGVRRHAILLSEPQLARRPEFASAVLSLLNDADPQVQMQLAYSLGEWNDPRATAALTRLALAHHADPYLLPAVLSSVKQGNVTAVVNDILSISAKEQLPEPLVGAVIMLAANLGDAACIRDTFTALSHVKTGAVSTESMIAAAELLRELDSSKRLSLLSDAANRDGIDRLAATAQKTIENESQTEAALIAALRILSLAVPDNDDTRAAISHMLGPQSPPAVQQAAVNAIAQTNPAWAADVLLENWPSYTPAIRERVVAAFFARELLLPALLAAIKAGDVQPVHLDALQRQLLLTHTDPKIREQATDALAGAINSDRAKIVADFAAVANLAGDTTRGRELFGKQCASCHKLEDQGHAVGPDLAALTNRTLPALVESLLDPNRVIDERYQTYTATTDEGLIHTGILIGETAASITLLEQQGKEHTLLRRSLDDLVNSRLSLMPEGFERDLSPQDVADVLAYVAAQGQPTPPDPGDPPSVASQDAAAVISTLLENLAVGTPQEYERIPAIWRAAIAAGKRNEADELRRVLAISLPKPDEPLRHWQAVVLGGGVINGLTQAGVWPRSRITELIQSDKDLQRSWPRVIELAAIMADDEAVPTGTRYDALRMLGVDTFEHRGPQLVKYLPADPELQMGAVSGLGDIDSPAATTALIASFSTLQAENQELAIEALLRSDDRIAALRDAVESGKIPRMALQPAQLEKLDEVAGSDLRE